MLDCKVTTIELLELGADTTIECFNKKTAQDIALEKNI